MASFINSRTRNSFIIGIYVLSTNFWKGAGKLYANTVGGNDILEVDIPDCARQTLNNFTRFRETFFRSRNLEQLQRSEASCILSSLI